MDKISECLTYRKRIEEIVSQISLKATENIINQGTEEHEVHYDINEAWKDYSFILNGVLYRWDKCINRLRRTLEEIKMILEKMPARNSITFLPPSVSCNLLSYEFEDFIVSFPRLNEMKLIDELCRIMSQRNANRLKENVFSRSNVNSLYWKINLLRNRSAHSTPGYYSIKDEIANRYESFSSQIKIVEIQNGNIFLKTNLINLGKNELIKNFIQEKIIEKKEGEKVARKRVMDLLFPLQVPTGKGKNAPQLLHIQNIERFDLNTDFLDLSKEILEYIENQLLIIQDEIEKS